jgi:hypothetical protein
MGAGIDGAEQTAEAGTMMNPRPKPAARRSGGARAV